MLNNLHDKQIKPFTIIQHINIILIYLKELQVQTIEPCNFESEFEVNARKEKRHVVTLFR